jgi:hypothetical protein
MIPDWVLPFKEPKTEIKLINGAYYKYAVSYRYDKEKKRTNKVTGHLLGKITHEDGFVPSDKDSLRKQGEPMPKIDIKTYGTYHLFSNLLSEEIASLKTSFGMEEAEKLLILAMMRWAHQSPIKRVPHYYANDFCSQHWHKGTLTEKSISQNLRHFGQNREKVVEWMRTLLGDAEKMETRFVMMDSTHIHSLSGKLAINAIGYNSSFNYDKQIRLMYIFSALDKQPVYYRLINGNITDSSSMPLCLREFGAQNVVFVADKGFYSEENIRLLDKHDMQYIIPLRRSNAMIDYTSPKKLAAKEDKNYFFYQDRPIWYRQYIRESKHLITFLDEHLRVSEDSDYLRRIETAPEKNTYESYVEKVNAFGTMTIMHKTKQELNPSEIYETYKQRGEIETMFDSYKNYLDADATYMQDRYVMEGWLLANFIAMAGYYKLFSRLKQAWLLSKYSPKDIVERSKAVYMVKIGGEWNMSETTAKFRELFKKIGILWS